MQTEADRLRLFHRRALLIAGAQGAFGLALAGRLAYLSLFKTDEYTLLAEDNRVALRLIPPSRAVIYDRTGKPLALNRNAFRLTMIPEEAGNIDAALDRLAAIYPVTDEERLRIKRAAARQASFQPVEIAADLDWDAFSAINVRLPELPGIQPVQLFTRSYPEGAAFAHLLGYIGPPSEAQVEAADDPVFRAPGFAVGKGGIEQSLETRLRGTAGVAKVEVNARGRIIRDLERIDGKIPPPLTLTIDRDLQRFVQDRLAGESASVIVFDAPTGEILSLAAVPGFDPNSFIGGISTAEWRALTGDERHPLLNKPVQGQYPPGSTFKMAVALAALEAGVPPEDSVVCTGRYQLGSHTFHCWRRRGHGRVDMASGIYSSCDTYFYATGRRIGADAIAAMARKLGLGETFDLPIPSQKSGLVPDAAWKRRRYNAAWQTGDTVNYAIGQGYLLTTPLQLGVMVARLASGLALQPHLVRDEARPPPAPLDLNPEHLAFVRNAMADVVNRGGGTARAARLQGGILMAGKTGTAQVRRITMAERRAGVRRNEDLPWKQRDHALFVCFAPVDQPRYACAVIVDHGGSGSKAAAPVARDIMNFLFARDSAALADAQAPDAPDAPDAPESPL